MANATRTAFSTSRARAPGRNASAPASMASRAAWKYRRWSGVGSASNTTVLVQSAREFGHRTDLDRDLPATEVGDIGNRCQQCKVRADQINLPTSYDVEAATVRELGCLLLARIDGKSKIEYITDEGRRGFTRDLARSILVGRATTINPVIDDLGDSIASLRER